MDGSPANGAIIDAGQGCDRRDSDLDATRGRHLRKAVNAVPNRWLLKTEPSTYSFADLQRDRKTTWDGVSNPVAPGTSPP